MTKYFCLSIIFINPKQGKASFFKILFLFFYTIIYILPLTRRIEEEEKNFEGKKKTRERKGRQSVWMREREHSFSLLLCNIERVYVCLNI
jgi:hypothetical protein